MTFFSSLWRLSIGMLLFATACTTTTRKMKSPVFTAPLDSVAQGVYRLVVSQHVNVDGWENATNGKVSDLLEIQIYNGQHMPADDPQLKALGDSIAVRMRHVLKDKGEYDTYRVVFIKVDSGSVVTKKSWRAFIYKATEL